MLLLNSRTGYLPSAEDLRGFQTVDRLILKQGFEHRHTAYPFEVLAHQVTKMAPRHTVRRTVPFKFGLDFFGIQGRVALVTRQQGRSPRHGDTL